MELIELLRKTIGTGEIVTVTYNGGSRPGQSRKIIPLSLSEDELTGIEPNAFTQKSYKLNLIALIELSSGERLVNTEAETKPIFNGPIYDKLLEYVEFFSPELQSAGWQIFKSETSFGLGAFFKNGKPKKNPSISIQYVDRSTETIFDPDLGDFVEIKKESTGRERPWRVDSWRFKQGKSLAQLHQAFMLFMEEARASSPLTAK